MQQRHQFQAIGTASSSKSSGTLCRHRAMPESIHHLSSVVPARPKQSTASLSGCIPARRVRHINMLSPVRIDDREPGGS